MCITELPYRSRYNYILVLKSQLHPELLLSYFKEQIPSLKDNFKNFQVINLKWTRATEKCLFINIVRTLEAKTEVKIVTDCWPDL